MYKDIRICSDAEGTSVVRDSSKKKCPFKKCPKGACTLDVKKCPGGTFVGRDSSKRNCPFLKCPKVHKSK